MTLDNQHIIDIYMGLATLKCQTRQSLFYPLFSQPLLELALSLPTDESFSGNYDRYPWRKAIHDYFKTDLVWRRDKGETSGIIQKALHKNIKKIMPLCLEGKMVQQNLIDKDFLYDHIKYMESGYSLHQWPLINLICAELFFNYWEI